MYVAKESFMDEFIWKIFKNLGSGSAFSCILDVQFLKKNSGYRRRLPRLRRGEKNKFSVEKSADQNEVLVGAFPH